MTEDRYPAGQTNTENSKGMADGEDVPHTPPPRTLRPVELTSEEGGPARTSEQARRPRRNFRARCEAKKETLASWPGFRPDDGVTAGNYSKKSKKSESMPWITFDLSTGKDKCRTVRTSRAEARCFTVRRQMRRKFLALCIKCQPACARPTLDKTVDRVRSFQSLRRNLPSLFQPIIVGRHEARERRRRYQAQGQLLPDFQKHAPGRTNPMRIGRQS